MFNYERLLYEFGEMTGLQNLRFTPQGYCEFVLNDTIFCRLQWDEKHQRLLVIGEMAPPRIAPAQLLAMNINSLTANAPVIGWNAEDDVYYAWLVLAAENSTADDLCACVARLTDFITALAEQAEGEAQ